MKIQQQANPLESVGHRITRCVAQSESDAAYAILDLAAGQTSAFTPKSWQAVLDALTRCNETVDEWLEKHSQ